MCRCSTQHGPGGPHEDRGALHRTSMGTGEGTPFTAQEGYNVQTSSDCTPRNAAADEKRQRHRCSTQVTHPPTLTQGRGRAVCVLHQGGESTRGDQRGTQLTGRGRQARGARARRPRGDRAPRLLPAPHRRSYCACRKPFEKPKSPRFDGGGDAASPGSSERAPGPVSSSSGGGE